MWWAEMRALALVCGVLVAAALTGCKAGPPGKAESSAMWGFKHHIFIGGKKQRNPLAASAQTISDGKDAFSHYCAACHGLDGQNTGVPFADRMAPPVPSLASSEVQAYTDGQLKWVIDNGIWPSGMPGSSGTLSNDEIWSIVVYIRHLPKAGSLGEPLMYSQ